MTKLTPSVTRLVGAYLALLGLLAATIALSLLPHAGGSSAASLAIALAKSVIIILVFMDARRSTPLIWLAIVAGVAWLALLAGMTVTDILTRGL